MSDCGIGQGATLSLERSLQNLFERNLDRLLGVRFLASEYHTTNGRIDTLGMDENFMDVTRLAEEPMRSLPYEEVEGHVFGSHHGSKTNISDRNSHSVKLLVAGTAIAKEVRSVLRDRLGITCSAGIASNKVLAKLVGSRNKPDDQTVVFPGDDALALAALEERWIDV